MIEECKLGVDVVDEPQSSDVLEPIEADAEGRSIVMPIDRDHADFVLAACGG